jgi:hypothetical protein
MPVLDEINLFPGMLAYEINAFHPASCIVVLEPSKNANKRAKLFF